MSTSFSVYLKTKEFWQVENSWEFVNLLKNFTNKRFKTDDKVL